MKHVFVSISSILMMLITLQFSPALLANESTVRVNGTVQSVMLSKQMLKVEHEAVPEWGWMKMKMKFAVSPDVNIASLQKGQAVEMMLKKGPDGKAMIIEVK